MLEFTKTILAKVSFNQALFRKELEKAIRLLSAEERIKLKKWALYSYGTLYAESILEVFSSINR